MLVDNGIDNANSQRALPENDNSHPHCYVHHHHQVEDYIAFIQTFPGIDGPEVFGLHPNADLTFRNKEGQQLLATLMETQPKQAAGGTGRSREDMVSRMWLDV